MIDPSVYHTLSERLTKALIEGDFDLYAQVMTLPLEVNPLNDQSYVLSTREALEEDFILYHQANTAHHMTDIYRQVRQIRTIADSRVAVDIWVELLSQASRVVDPFPSTHYLRKTQDGWRIFQIDSSPGHINWTLRRATISTDGKFTLLPDQGDAD